MTVPKGKLKIVIVLGGLPFATPRVESKQSWILYAAVKVLPARFAPRWRPSWTGKHGKGLNALQLPIVGTYLTPALHTLLPREKRKGPSHLKAKRARLIFVN
jgi:hypothetical protein